MLKPYHAEISQRALGSVFSPRALNVIIVANMAQDGLRGQIGHPELHFDDNAFEDSYLYIEKQRQIVLDTLHSGKGSLSPHTVPAWEAFGRLVHTAQDFYAHSNYIKLWMDANHQKEAPSPTGVNAVQSEILHHPDLRSGKVNLWDWLAFIPGLHGLARRILPLDSHTHMNLDSPKQGSLFPYALEAATKRTAIEYHQIAERLSSVALICFKDR